jgi:hypothetical protein
MRDVPLLSALSCLIVLLRAAVAAVDAEPARSADAFVDFVGVNTHLGYYDTTYRDYEGILKPRLLFVYFNRGMTKAYKYELLDLKPDPRFTDMERHFGLVRTNGAPKPSFLALKNLLHLLADPGPAAPSSSLAFQLSGATNNVHHTLLKKRDGTFWLALFQEAASYDAKTRRDLEVPPATVTLTLPWTAPQIRLFRPNASAGPTERIAASSEVELAVPDEVLLVEIKPPQQTIGK